MKKLLAVIILFSTVGCVPPSLNLQRSVLRGTGDTAVTFVMDEVSDGKVDETLWKIKSIVGALNKFLEDGKVAGLTRSELSTEILKIVPAKYKNWADQLLAVVSSQDITVDQEKIVKIGPNNVLRLKAFLKGALKGLEEYNKDHRPVEEKVEEPPVPAAGGSQPVSP